MHELQLQLRNSSWKYFSKMASDGGLKVDNPAESIDSLSKEVENLKTRLEEERKKLNDVARKSLYLINTLIHTYLKLYFCVYIVLFIYF